MRNRDEGTIPSVASMTLAEFEATIDEAIARVEGGETIIIERDGEPSVRLEPPPPTAVDRA